MKNWFITLMLIISGPVVAYSLWHYRSDIGDVIATCGALWFCAYLVFSTSNDKS